MDISTAAVALPRYADQRHVSSHDRHPASKLGDVSPTAAETDTPWSDGTYQSEVHRPGM